MEACFHHRKKNKKGNFDFSSHSSFSSQNSQNCMFISHSSYFMSCVSDFLSFCEKKVISNFISIKDSKSLSEDEIKNF